MNQRLNLEQAVQFVVSPGSGSELSELLDIDDDEEDEIIQFLQKKKGQRTLSITSISCFLFAVSFTFHYCSFAYFLWHITPRSSI